MNNFDPIATRGLLGGVEGRGLKFIKITIFKSREPLNF